MQVRKSAKNRLAIQRYASSYKQRNPYCNSPVALYAALRYVIMLWSMIYQALAISQYLHALRAQSDFFRISVKAYFGACSLASNVTHCHTIPPSQ